MGKASSAKKVARASRAGGGGKVSSQRSLTFPVTIAVVLVLGFALVIFASRDNEATADDSPPRANSDHWHAAYGIYACDAFLTPITVQDDPEGIHSHADGVIHVHPWVGAAAGKNATLQVFADAVGLELSNDEITVPGVATFKNGQDCNGEPATWQAAVWNDENAENADNRHGGLRRHPLHQRPHADHAGVRARGHRHPEAARARASSTNSPTCPRIRAPLRRLRPWHREPSSRSR